MAKRSQSPQAKNSLYSFTKLFKKKLNSLCIYCRVQQTAKKKHFLFGELGSKCTMRKNASNFTQNDPRFFPVYILCSAEVMFLERHD